MSFCRVKFLQEIHSGPKGESCKTKTHLLPHRKLTSFTSSTSPLETLTSTSTLTRNRVTYVQQVKAVKPRETHPLPRLFTFLPTAQMLMDGGWVSSVGRRRWVSGGGGVKGEKEVLKNEPLSLPPPPPSSRHSPPPPTSNLLSFTVAYVYQVKALKEKHVNVRPTGESCKTKREYPPTLFTSSLNARIFDRRGLSVCRRKMELSL